MMRRWAILQRYETVVAKAILFFRGTLSLPVRCVVFSMLLQFTHA